MLGLVTNNPVPPATAQPTRRYLIRVMTQFIRKRKLPTCFIMTILLSLTITMMMMMGYQKDPMNSIHDHHPRAVYTNPIIQVEAVPISSYLIDESYDHITFRERVATTITKLQQLLTSNIQPSYPADVAHQYQDKYELVQWLGNSLLGAEINTLAILGLGDPELIQIMNWVASNKENNSQEVTLRFHVEEYCDFIRDAERKVESDTQVVTTGVLFSSTTKVVHTVREWFWGFKVDWSIFVVRGDSKEILELLTKRGEVELVTNTKQSPKPQHKVYPDQDVSITWLLKQLVSKQSKKDSQPLPPTSSDIISFPNSFSTNFTINRLDSSCRTPRRNVETFAALTFTDSMYSWCSRVKDYLDHSLIPHQTNSIDWNSVSRQEDTFSPIVPFFDAGSPRSIKLNSDEEGSNQTPRSSTFEDPLNKHATPVPTSLHLDSLLREHQRSLNNRVTILSKLSLTDRPSTLISSVELKLMFASYHMMHLFTMFRDGVNSVEEMLREQLVTAIGQDFSSQDFHRFMTSHWNSIMKEGYTPQPFVFAVRRPDHYPEGVVSIDMPEGDGKSLPIITTVKALGKPELTSLTKNKDTTHASLTDSGKAAASASSSLVSSSDLNPTLSFFLNAATEIQLAGERYLHSYIDHQFSGGQFAQLKLNCRSRPFSSFMVLLGHLSTSSRFQPEHAFILQNSEELSVALELHQLPSAREFEDSIQSLSPEQQRFAKAIRANQLSSSLFTLVIVQLKPALEVLLHLPSDSLTKEIKLTQDLLDLFIRYQIPSDLLSYDGAHNTTKEMQLNTVKGYVTAIQEMIRLSEDRTLASKQQEAQYDTLESVIEQDDLVFPPTAHLNSNRPRRRIIRKSLYQSSSHPAPNMAPPEAIGSSAYKVNIMRSAPQSDTPTILLSPTPNPAPPTSTISSPLPASLDLTGLPGLLDQQLLLLDTDSSLHPTKISVGSDWSKSSPQSIISRKLITRSLDISQQTSEKNAAFDLLDALSRSGSIILSDTSTHILLANTHAFDQSLINTVIQDNVNPIEKLDRSLMVIMHTLQQQPLSAMVKPIVLDQLKQFEPSIKTMMEQDKMKEQEIEANQHSLHGLDIDLEQPDGTEVPITFVTVGSGSRGGHHSNPSSDQIPALNHKSRKQTETRLKSQRADEL